MTIQSTKELQNAFRYVGDTCINVSQLDLLKAHIKQALRERGCKRVTQLRDEDCDELYREVHRKFKWSSKPPAEQLKTVWLRVRVDRAPGDVTGQEVARLISLKLNDGNVVEPDDCTFESEEPFYG